MGANTVRVVLSGGRWTANTASDVANVIALCKQNKLICVLEDHDTTGYGEDGAAYTLDQAVNYWISLKSVLVGQENYIVINIGNEPIGNTNPGQWTAATAAAIQKMRSNGFEHLLMVDAPNWGQDWQYVMRDNAQTVLDADTQHNTVLSIHMYAVFNTGRVITSLPGHLPDQGLAAGHRRVRLAVRSSEVDDQTLLSEAVARNLGYLGWSWAGNNDPILDMTATSTPTSSPPGASGSSTAPTGSRPPPSRPRSTAGEHHAADRVRHQRHDHRSADPPRRSTPAAEPGRPARPRTRSSVSGRAASRVRYG